MNQMSPEEKSLHALLSDMGSDGGLKTRMAELHLKHLDPQLKQLSYDEAIALGRQAEEHLEVMGPFDPAFAYFVNQRNQFYQLAGYINDKDTMGRKEHLIPCHLLVSVGSIAVEATLHIPKANYSKLNHDAMVRREIFNRLNTSSTWGNVRNRNTVDFVPL